MFNQKYIPSVKNNNAKREEFLNEFKAFIYKLEKGKYHPGLDGERVAAVTERLNELADELASSIGTGEENIGLLAEDGLKQLKTLRKEADDSVTHRFEEAAEELGYTLGLWKDVLDGDAVLETPEDITMAKVSRSRKKLNARLAELEEVKKSFTQNDRRLESEIAELEKDLAEYEGAMLREENERKINDLYRQIKAVKSKADMLTVRHNNYSACYNLLDVIYANAREILQATDYAAEEIAKAKVFLDVEKLKKVVVDPDRAIAVLKRMDDDIKQISAKTSALDSRVFGLDSGSAEVNQSALAYKEELMRKQREKQNLEAAEKAGNITEKKTEDKTDGIL